MATTTAAATTTIESPGYHLWQEWAFERRATCRDHRLSDLLSEHIDPAEERHMTQLISQRDEQQKNQQYPQLAQQQEEWLLRTLMQSQSCRQKVEFSKTTTSSPNQSSTTTTAAAASLPKGALELGISTIIAMKMISVRLRMPIRWNDIIVNSNSGKDDGSGKTRSAVFAASPTAGVGPSTQNPSSVAVATSAMAGSNSHRHNHYRHHLQQPEILQEDANSLIPRGRVNSYSNSNHTNPRSSTTSLMNDMDHAMMIASSTTTSSPPLSSSQSLLFTSTTTPPIPDVSGMHIPPELHASYSFIHEQHAIWNEIVLSKTASAGMTTTTAKRKATDDTSRGWMASTAYHHDNDDDDCARNGSHRYNKSDKSSSNLTSSYSRRSGGVNNGKDLPDSLEGQHVELHGSLIKILGRHRVYDALANGTTKIITCIGCETKLLATLDTRLLYCPDCGTLSKIELTTTTPTSSLQRPSSTPTNTGPLGDIREAPLLRMDANQHPRPQQQQEDEKEEEKEEEKLEVDDEYRHDGCGLFV